jgi:hypothetical protein
MNMSSLRFAASAIAISLLLISCAEPVPPEKMSYVGEWQSKEMYLLILADSSVKYERGEKRVRHDGDRTAQKIQRRHFLFLRQVVVGVSAPLFPPGFGARADR